MITSSRETGGYAPGTGPVAHDQGWIVVGRLREAHLAMTDAVLRGDGLPRVAELAATGAGGAVAIALPALGTAIASREPGGHRALTRWAAERGRGRPSIVLPNLLAEVPIRLGEEVVGVVALLRTGAAPRAGATEFLHLAATAAMTKLAIEDAKDAVERSLRASFVERLRCDDELDGAEIVRRAARLGCDLSRGAVVLGVELECERPQLILATIAEEHPGALAELLEGTAQVRARIYAVLPPTGAASPEATLASARRLAARLRRLGVVGLSSFYSEPAELGRAAREAELVLDVLRHSDADVAGDMGSGTYKLLFRVLASHPEEMRAFYAATIAPLVEYDDQCATELTRTLQAYFDANCSMSDTAAAIYAHRHTIAYRLDRIRDLTGLDPALCEDRERLGLGLKVHRLIAPGARR